MADIFGLNPIPVAGEGCNIRTWFAEEVPVDVRVFLRGSSYPRMHSGPSLIRRDGDFLAVYNNQTVTLYAFDALDRIELPRPASEGDRRQAIEKFKELNRANDKRPLPETTSAPES